MALEPTKEEWLLSRPNRIQPSVPKRLAEVWSDEGRQAMVKTAKTNPTVFFATCARLIPQDVKPTVESVVARQFESTGLGSNTGDRESRSPSHSGRQL